MLTVASKDCAYSSDMYSALWVCLKVADFVSVLWRPSGIIVIQIDTNQMGKQCQLNYEKRKPGNNAV